MTEKHFIWLLIAGSFIWTMIVLGTLRWLS